MSMQSWDLARLLSDAASRPSGCVHCLQVATVATSLFDELKSLHAYTEPERDLLWAACILHDIGWSAGRKGHHKLSCDLILSDRTLPFDEEQRLTVALVARYHRRALPDSARHRLFGGLSRREQEKVRWLAALIRVADELDTTHASLVRGVRCRVTGDSIAITCAGPVPDQRVMASRMHKLDLLTEVTERKCSVSWEVPG